MDVTSGVYGLFSLDGAPLDPADLQALGLGQAPFTTKCAVGRAVDSHPDAMHLYQSETEALVLAGFLDEPEELSAALSLPSHTPHAELAAHALRKYGPATPRQMEGDWSLIRCCLRSHQVTLLTAITMRDQVSYAMDGNKLAVAPDPLTLCRLNWVGRTLDPEGMALYLARASLRSLLRSQTAWKNVRRVMPGTAEIFGHDGQRTVEPTGELEPELFSGSFDDAVEEITAKLRHVVGKQMHRYGRTAFLLSGGLDSTTLSAMAAVERDQVAEAFCLTSISPEGSAIPDEQPWSRPAAVQLGMDLQTVCPPPDASPFRPAAAMFEHLQHPMPGLRHYLYPLFWQTASALGARAVVDGVKGEFCITQKPARGSDLPLLRRWRYRALMAWRERQSADSSPKGAFHARISDDLLALLPEEGFKTNRVELEWTQRLSADQPIGYHPALGKMSGGQGNAAPFGMRHLEPFRNPRLLRFTATLPGRFYMSKEHSRPLPRAILRGRVPEAVRLRKRGLPISPDYLERYPQHAAAVRDRLPIYREAGAGAWVDLPWLESVLPSIEAHSLDQRTLYVAHFTACTAEFLVWAAHR